MEKQQMLLIKRAHEKGQQIRFAGTSHWPDFPVLKKALKDNEDRKFLLREDGEILHIEISR